MKIKPEHYDKLKSFIARIPKESIAAQRAVVAKCATTHDIDKRLRWDCFYTIKDFDFRDELSYLDNNHIDTALKTIFKELTQ